MEIPNQSNDFCFDFVTFNHFAQKKNRFHSFLLNAKKKEQS